MFGFIEYSEDSNYMMQQIKKSLDETKGAPIVWD